ncbi:hypothetical protein CROQUDRAFT_101242 [Cronartium quercuum f. sp. fusiforme G11]|uniref:Uncharacterized protein n=1 Tax=Cronartium quercuum f. sp. fusiforme G11 TaxID=708437 RepID=A0A9P6N8D9_9BASI|nr:hypothetical protein CROQUDRAFT_101242 [Cronartium quercuum f. sp. fusiforme G11]
MVKIVDKCPSPTYCAATETTKNLRFGIDQSKFPKTPKKSSLNLLRSSPKSPAEIWESNASTEVFTTSSEGQEPKKLPMRNQLLISGPYHT